MVGTKDHPEPPLMKPATFPLGPGGKDRASIANGGRADAAAAQVALRPTQILFHFVARLDNQFRAGPQPWKAGRPLLFIMETACSARGQKKGYAGQFVLGRVC